MGKVEIGVNNIGTIYLQLSEDRLRIDDEINDGFIVCHIKKLRDTIRIIENAYKKRDNLHYSVYGSSHLSIQLTEYQRRINKAVFYSNYIRIDHMPAIIKMLKSVKVKKEKYILDNNSLLNLCINDLIILQQTMKRRKKVLTDNNGCKYIEV